MIICAVGVFVFVLLGLTATLISVVMFLIFG